MLVDFLSMIYFKIYTNVTGSSFKALSTLLFFFTDNRITIVSTYGEGYLYYSLPIKFSKEILHFTYSFKRVR